MAAAKAAKPTSPPRLAISACSSMRSSALGLSNSSHFYPLAEASQPIFRHTMSGNFGISCKRTGNQANAKFPCLDRVPVNYMDFSLTQIEVDATTFTVFRTCKIPSLCMEIIIISLHNIQVHVASCTCRTLMQVGKFVSRIYPLSVPLPSVTIFPHSYI